MRYVVRYLVAASPVFDAAATSPDFDIVAALPALVECTVDFCRGRFARVFVAAAALGNSSLQPTQLVHPLGCLGHSLYRHAIA
jgi:hypothetical protein